jgi:hypothetical protein
MNAALAHALEYAARGWFVLPLHPVTLLPVLPRHDAIGCDRSDPWCLDGHVDWEPRATTDADRIFRLWRAHPWAIGIACGPSGLLVLDTTRDPYAAESALYDLAARRGKLPSTWSVSPPTGGLHRYFSCSRAFSPDRDVLGSLVGIRCSGSYVVAPPAVTPEGPYLTLVTAPVAPVPDWLWQVLTERGSFRC